MSEYTEVMHGVVYEQVIINDQKDSKNVAGGTVPEVKVFRLATDLVAVTTGYVACDEVKHSLLQAQVAGNTVTKNVFFVAG